MDRLKELLTEHARKLPSYRRVETDAFEVCFHDGSTRIELREPYKGKCWMCDGKGKGGSYYDYDDPNQTLPVVRRVGETIGLKIMVSTNGKDISPGGARPERVADGDKV